VVQAQIGVQGTRRVKRIATLQTQPLKLQVQLLANRPYDRESEDLQAKHFELVASLKRLFEQQPMYLDQIRHVRTADFQV
jgi:hypothetical protein